MFRKLVAFEPMFRMLNRRGSPQGRPLVSHDLRTDEISAAGGHQFFVQRADAQIAPLRGTNAPAGNGMPYGKKLRFTVYEARAKEKAGGNDPPAAESS